ncbi:MAG: DUF423 domain-containing protein [Nannocystaceae bacterium]|nr:DUF423 domain-containing protein [bacterium]
MSAPIEPLAGRVLVVGAVLGLIGVAAGAFGAHALRDAVPTRDLEIWRTAAHYQQLHAAVLVGVAALGRTSFTKALRVAAIAFVVGIVIFAGTLDAIVLGGPRVLGAVTPVGGLCLMAGWAALAVHGLGLGRGDTK